MVLVLEWAEKASESVGVAKNRARAARFPILNSPFVSPPKTHTRLFPWRLAAADAVLDVEGATSRLQEDRTEREEDTSSISFSSKSSPSPSVPKYLSQVALFQKRPSIISYSTRSPCLRSDTTHDSLSLSRARRSPASPSLRRKALLRLAAAIRSSPSHPPSLASPGSPSPSLASRSSPPHSRSEPPERLKFSVQEGEESPDPALAKPDPVAARPGAPDPDHHQHQMEFATVRHRRGTAIHHVVTAAMRATYLRARGDGCRPAAPFTAAKLLAPVAARP